MSSCCDEKTCDLEKMSKDQSKVLWIVLFINVVMFVVEFSGGFIAKSLSLTGDSFDMLGDSLAYGASLYVINMGMAAKAKSAMFKGSIIMVSAFIIFGAAVYRTFFLEVPVFEVMGAIGLLALAANGLCLFLLTRHKSDDVNMASVWLCSRNDIISNVSILGAAFLVSWTGSPWPDLIVGIALAFLFIKSALYIFSESRRELALANK